MPINYQKKIHDYPAHSWIECIDDYKLPEGDWENCPYCNLKPKVWCFDNGRSTACGCWDSEYLHFSIRAESIMSHYTRTGNTEDYDHDALRKNWNHFCKTGEVIFNPNYDNGRGRW